MSGPRIVVRRVRPEDGRVLRGVRLRALTDAPEAFGSTYEAEIQLDQGFWDRRAARGASGRDQATFLAFADGGVAGMAGGYHGEDEPGTCHLVGMWVDPAWRRSGLGRRLVDQVVSWATDHEADRIVLWVTEGNEAARRLYASAGFAPTGTTQPLPSFPDLTERLLELRIGGGDPWDIPPDAAG